VAQSETAVRHSAARPVRTRRTQEERTAETRRALIDASIKVIHRLGYGGATTALIAEEAGVSRGAILHHFGTRAVLMAEVIRDVFEREHAEYARLDAEAHLGHRVADWPAMLWQVFSQPSGLAVLEILQAARSDRDLSDRVTATQQAIEELATATMKARFKTPADGAFVDRMRLVVWAIRGLSIAKVLIKDPEEIGRSVELFSRILAAAEDAGVFSKH
jgi:AcrR family transcriptional regulator